MNTLLNLLIPYRNSHEIDFRIKKQLPYIAITALFLLVAFILLIFVVLVSSNGKMTLFIAAITTLIAILISALLFLRNGRYEASSRLMSLILFAGSMAALYMMPYTSVPIEAYRPFAFMVVMSTCNIIIALEKKQIVAFYLGLIAGWSIAYMTIFNNHFSVDKAQTMSILMVGLLGLSVANGVLYLLDTLSDELLDNANTQMKGAQNAYSDLSKILMEARRACQSAREYFKHPPRFRTHYAKSKKLNTIWAQVLITYSVNLTTLAHRAARYSPTYVDEAQFR